MMALEFVHFVKIEKYVSQGTLVGFDQELTLKGPAFNELTHWGLDEMANILQTTFASDF